jgi:hypothetical protein
VKVELLYLDEASMRTHLNKLGSDYSVIGAIAELLPEQLRLIQERTKSRNGRLVSVQQGAPADMVTQMGTFKIKSVIFVITVATLPEKKDVAEKTDSVLAKAREEMTQPDADNVKANFFTFDSVTHRLVRNDNSNDAPFSGAPVNKVDNQGFSSLFRHNLEPTKTTSLFQTNGPVSATPFGAPTQPVPVSQGEIGFVPFEEQDGYSNASSNYMSITFTIPYQSLSFEELRITNYATGRTDPAKVDVKWNGWGTPPFSDKKPFGGQYKNPNANDSLFEVLQVDSSGVNP